LSVMCATELEFYLFKDSYEECEEKHWGSLVPHSSTIEDYQIFQTSREEYILRRIRNEMIAARVPVEFSKGEAGRGQHEVNVTYADALETADRHLVFKNGVKEIAAQEGRAATFMAKWTMGEVGSSCHVHASLWRDTEPLMADEATPGKLSQVGRRFLAGQLHAARSLAWCFAPTLNSYRRYISGSWAPTAVVWGEDNRTCGFRVIGKGAGCRIENRIPGADVNPYIALAATIAAGLYGIEHDLELTDAFKGNAYETPSLERIPSTLVHSLGELEKSEVAKEAFGNDVHAHLVNTARQEWEASNGVVTDWELRRNFERI
jgi:glutamine synthetase